MSKGKSKKVRKVDTLLVTSPMIVKLLGDTLLYRRIPAFAPLFEKVLRTRDKLECVLNSRLQDFDTTVRQQVGELVDEFRRIVCEQVDADGGVALYALRRLLRDRHNLDVGALLFFCRQPDGQLRKILL